MFTEDKVFNIQIDNPDALAQLVIEYLCSEKYHPTIIEHEKDLIKRWLENAKKNSINFNQFNELLLLLNQDKVNREFFNFFFKKERITLGELKQGIINFRGFAMLCFGNFRSAYKYLTNKTLNEIKDCLKQFCKDEQEIKKYYSERLQKMLTINKIPKNETWCLGYISRERIKKEAIEVKKEILKSDKGKSLYNIDELIELSELIQKYNILLKNTHKVALQNTDIYLTWDYIDIYIATSMREKWEFEDTYDFIEELFKNDKLQSLKLRYFDPTQSLLSNPRDKGLLEGLMLKCTSCTIYLAQETDTMGKDSELAATLAQSKPVIAYVPKLDPLTYSEKIKDYPLDFFKKRFLILNAEGYFNDPDITKILKKHDKNYEKFIQDFLDKYDEYRQIQPFTLWKKKEIEFKKNYQHFKKICNILGEIESYYFNKRATLLRERHPLSMQVDLETGVANGVLIVRTIEDCAKLLYNILMNKMTFTIKDIGYENDVLNTIDKCTILEENISKSPFRVITAHEKLTNSFWNLWK